MDQAFARIAQLNVMHREAPIESALFGQCQPPTM
jgi:hypothetical protein